nr:hypothetical protein GCM10020063_059280 [Dactylosporangium thailandense]
MAWRHGVALRGRDAVVPALLRDDRALHDVEWLIGTGRWEALCSARCGGHHLSMLLRVVAGNWQVVYQHTA